MAHYYIDFPNTPPPFGRSMPGAIGYISKGGLEVLYGQKTRGDIQRQLHMDHVPENPDAVQKRIAEIVAAPPKPVWLLPAGICEICQELRGMTKHHLAPKQLINLGVAEHRGFAHICRPCHDKVHIHFTNPQLLNTHWPDVVEKIREVIMEAQIKKERHARESQEALIRKAKREKSTQPLRWPALAHAWPK